jgi:hypothetical protein
MDTKTLVKALKVAVREVIKEELTEILREGLQSTINEMAKPKQKVKVDTNKMIRTEPRMVNDAGRKSKVQFNENRWASVLNQTDALQDKNMPIESYSDMMNESYDTMSFTSRDAQGFAMNRQNMNPNTSTPAVMEDPETGKIYDVAPEVQQAITRDYSALMKAMNKKKGN